MTEKGGSEKVVNTEQGKRKIERGSDVTREEGEEDGVD